MDKGGAADGDDAVEHDFGDGHLFEKQGPLAGEEADQTDFGVVDQFKEQGGLGQDQPAAVGRQAGARPPG